MEKCGAGNRQVWDYRLRQPGPQDFDGADGWASGEPSECPRLKAKAYERIKCQEAGPDAIHPLNEPQQVNDGVLPAAQGRKNVPQSYLWLILNIFHGLFAVLWVSNIIDRRWRIKGASKSKALSTSTPLSTPITPIRHSSTTSSTTINCTTTRSRSNLNPSTSRITSTNNYRSISPTPSRLATRKESSSH